VAVPRELLRAVLVDPDAHRDRVGELAEEVVRLTLDNARLTAELERTTRLVGFHEADAAQHRVTLERALPRLTKKARAELDPDGELAARLGLP
jgi:hypothetical protein